MAKRKNHELTHFLKACLQMFVARSSSTEPVRLEGELELGARFFLSRPTVHQALEELEQENWIFHLPGKRGFYTNPQKASPHLLFFGIISSNADARFGFPLFLSGLSGELSNVMLHFPHFLQTTAEELYTAIRNYSYSGILWMNPNPIFYPVIQRLIADGLPLIVSDFYHSELPFPPENYASLDISVYVKQCWKIFQRKNYHFILYYTTTDRFFHAHKAKAPENVRYEQLRSASDLASFRTAPPDLILADGGESRYRELFAELELWNVSELPDIYCYPGAVHQMSSECKQKLNGKIFFVPAPKKFNDEYRLGKLSAKRLLALVKK